MTMILICILVKLHKPELLFEFVEVNNNALIRFLSIETAQIWVRI